ncbi:MAG: hypothetical protein ACFB4I_03475 [Cyanophyceae cyanobacterium]
MIVFKRLEQAMQSVWEGIIRLFSSSDNDYPNSGVQPFSGDPYDDQHSSEF